MRGAAVEDYLKAIYKLQTPEQAVSTTALAERMGTTAAAATKMLKHLAMLSLVAYTPYRGARLTRPGEKIALEVIRHHRLLERYLAEAVGYSWDQVHAEAEHLEHVISEEFEARIDALLGHPSVCPHGDPIPTRDGVLRETRLATLGECPTGAAVVIARVRDRDAGVLRALSARGLTLETPVQILGHAPGGLMTVGVAGREHVLTPALTGSIFVRPGEEAPRPPMLGEEAPA